MVSFIESLLFDRGNGRASPFARFRAARRRHGTGARTTPRWSYGNCSNEPGVRPASRQREEATCPMAVAAWNLAASAAAIMIAFMARSTSFFDGRGRSAAA